MSVEHKADRRYLLISPCRNEAEYIRRTLDAVVGQSVLPQLWLIVDDGSSDATPEILREYSQRYDFIKVLVKPDRGARSVGPGVVEAFYYGYESINPKDFSYICKFDVDLDIPPTYFERIIEKMERNPRIGTYSGKPYFPASSNLNRSFDGKLISEACGDEASVGMIKFYRRQCFEEIGGFVRQVNWDAIDCHRCRMLGWIAGSQDEEETRFIHLRPMGSSQQGILTGRVRGGFGQYFMGTSWYYMAANALYRMTRPPFVLGGLALAWGYVESAIQRRPRYDDDNFRRFLKKYHLECLLHGKAAATRRANAAGEQTWLENRGKTEVSIGN